MPRNKPFLSIVIPVYNESKRIDKITEVDSYFKAQKYPVEIIVVNDGSKDSTLAKLNKLSKKIRLRIISYRKNQGKGHAIKIGMLSARGDYCLFTDVDLSTPISEIEKFIPLFNQYDLIIGTRKNGQANVIVHQHPIRENMGKVFTFLSQIVLSVPVTDFTCGFKSFSSMSAKKIFSQSTIQRWGFDSEILFLAQKNKFSLKEVPVAWENDFRSRVKFPQDIINSLQELFTIIINDKVKHKYQ